MILLTPGISEQTTCLLLFNWHVGSPLSPSLWPPESEPPWLKLLEELVHCRVLPFIVIVVVVPVPLLGCYQA
jgi:hypothetical protein